MRAPSAIGFDCRTSPTLVVATVAVGMLAIVAVWISRGPHWLHLCLTLLVAGYTGATVGQMLRPRVKSLLWRADGGVDLVLDDTLTDGRREVQGVVRTARVMGPLIVLSLRWPRRGRATVWLLPDNLDADTRRRLRMRLGAGDAGLASGNADSG